MRRLLLTVVVLLVLAFALDRGAAWVAGNLASQQISKQLDATGVSTTFEGFPFLTQLAQRRFDTVDVSASSLTRQGYELHKINLVANGAAVAGPRVTAAGLTGHGLLSYDQVASIARLPQGSVSYAGNDEVAVREQVKVFGEAVTVRVVGKVTAGAGRLRLEPREVRLPGGKTVSADSLGGAQVRIDAPLPSPVQGVTITGATPQADGVVVDVSGQNVAVTG